MLLCFSLQIRLLFASIKITYLLTYLQCPGKIAVCRNKWVFIFRRNTSKDGADVMSSGRVFQSLGPATANERSLLLCMLSMKNVTAKYINFLLGHMKFLCPWLFTHNRNVAWKKQFVVILTKIPENPKPRHNRNYMCYRTSTANVLLCHSGP